MADQFDNILRYCTLLYFQFKIVVLKQNLSRWYNYRFVNIYIHLSVLYYESYIIIKGSTNCVFVKKKKTIVFILLGNWRNIKQLVIYNLVVNTSLKVRSLL